MLSVGANVHADDDGPVERRIGFAIKHSPRLSSVPHMNPVRKFFVDEVAELGEVAIDVPFCPIFGVGGYPVVNPVFGEMNVVEGVRVEADVLLEGGLAVGIEEPAPQPVSTGRVRSEADLVTEGGLAADAPSDEEIGLLADFAGFVDIGATEVHRLDVPGDFGVGDVEVTEDGGVAVVVAELLGGRLEVAEVLRYEFKEDLEGGVDEGGVVEATDEAVA